MTVRNVSIIEST